MACCYLLVFEDPVVSGTLDVVKDGCYYNTSDLFHCPLALALFQVSQKLVAILHNWDFVPPLSELIPYCLCITASAE